MKLLGTSLHSKDGIHFKAGSALLDRTLVNLLSTHYIPMILIPTTMSTPTTTETALQVKEEKYELVGGKCVFVVVLLFPCLVLIIIVLIIVSMLLLSKLNIFCQPQLHNMEKKIGERKCGFGV